MMAALLRSCDIRWLEVAVSFRILSRCAGMGRVMFSDIDVMVKHSAAGCRSVPVV